MSGWVAKRFWKDASASAADGGFAVLLDGRGVKTPAKTPLVVPTLALAQAIADEWQAQSEVIRPDAMPLTRAANSALDKVVPQFAGVVAEVAKYGATDLICYREPNNTALRDRQKAWDPLVEWAAGQGAPLVVTDGIIPVAQPEASLATLRARVGAASAFELVALYDLVAISGSLILGLAVMAKRLPATEAFALSRMDETWQAEQWGADEEAADTEEKKLQAFMNAHRFLELCR